MNGSLTDKGNAWKLIYAALVAVENAPEAILDDVQDEDGNWYEDMFCYTPNALKATIKDVPLEEIESGHIIYYSAAIRKFIEEYESGKASFPFSYESYLKNDDILDTIEGFGLNIEQFWYAILFIYWLTEIRCINVFLPEGNSIEQMQKLSDYLQGANDFTITVEGKKKLVINDLGVIANIRKSMNENIALYEERGWGDLTSHNSKSNHNESSSIQMTFATMRYIKLFENLELPTIRARNSGMKFKQLEGHRIAIGGEIKTVSYNKMLLVSRLMYFTRMTRKESYLVSDESLKGIVKQYKDLKLNTHHPKYLF